MGLTPLGLMYYFENYVGYDDKVFLLNVYGGSSPFYSNGYGGIKLLTNKLWTSQVYSLDVIGNLAYQPRLQLESCDPIENKNSWVGLVGINNQFKINESISVHASILYKNKGLIEGRVADGGCILGGGFTLHYWILCTCMSKPPNPRLLKDIALLYRGTQRNVFYNTGAN